MTKDEFLDFPKCWKILIFPPLCDCESQLFPSSCRLTGNVALTSCKVTPTPMDQERAVGQQCRDLLWDSFEATGQPASQGVKDWSRPLAGAGCSPGRMTEPGLAAFPGCRPIRNGSEGRRETSRPALLVAVHWVLCPPRCPTTRASKPASFSWTLDPKFSLVPSRSKAGKAGVAEGSGVGMVREETHLSASEIT